MLRLSELRKEALSAQRFKIPKKGRIRVVLALIGIILLVKLVCVPIAKSIPTPSASKKTSHTKGLFSCTPPSPFARTISRPELSALLSDHARNLQGAIDTIRDHQCVLHYTIDSSLTERAQELIAQYKPLYAGIVVMDPTTGRILTAYSFSRPDAPAKTDLWRTTVFPSASVFKTITAAAAIDMGKLNDQTELPLVGRKHTLYHFQIAPQIRGGDLISLEKSYAYSVNPIFARLGMFTIGYDNLINYAKAFGFGEKIPFEMSADSAHVMTCDSSYAVAELASGYNRVTSISPLFGAMIAAAIVENGAMPAPSIIDSVTDISSGKTMLRGIQGTWRTPIKPSTAMAIRRMMCATAQYGTGRRSFRYMKHSSRFNAFEYGGKTGSIDKDGLGHIDWFIGMIRHSTDPKQRLAIGIVTAHDAYWTVHSSFIAQELMRTYIRDIQIDEKERKAADAADSLERDTADTGDDEGGGGG